MVVWSLLTSVALSSVIAQPPKSLAIKDTVLTGIPRQEPSSLYFEENRGQFDDAVRYVVRGEKESTFLTTTGVVYALSIDSNGSSGTAVYMNLLGVSKNAIYSGVGPSTHSTNFLKGSDRTNWIIGAPNYTKVQVSDVALGSSMIWRGSQTGELQCDIKIEPGKKEVVDLMWEIKGANNVDITKEGDLKIHTDHGEIHQRSPRIHETSGLSVSLASRFVLLKSVDASVIRVGIEPKEYDLPSAAAFTPDAVYGGLAYSTYLGGSGTDNGNAIDIDHFGNAYVAGKTRSIAFPSTPGTFDPSFNNEFDVYVTKLNATGTALMYSTFIGGGANDECYGIATDSDGNAYVTGLTGSVGYPTTPGAYQTTFAGSGAMFVTKLNPTGTALVYSTFVGQATGYDIAIDDERNAYVIGGAGAGFPTTPGAFDSTFNGGFDAFVSKISAVGNQLVYSTYLGGAQNDLGRAIAIDSDGNAYATGYTQSSNFPVTTGAGDTSFNGGFDGFVTKLNSNGAQMIYSTFLGGSFTDQIHGIAVDSGSDVYVAGNTDSSNFPVTSGAFDTSLNGFQDDVFVSKINSTGNQLLYSTFLGGTDIDEGRGLTIDESGNAFITGWSMSTNFPTTAAAFDPVQNGQADVFLTQINVSGSQLIYSTFIGGNGADEGDEVALDPLGNAYIAGTSIFSSYPTTLGAFDTTYNGEADIIVAKLKIGVDPASISGAVYTPQGRAVRGAKVTIVDSNNMVRTIRADHLGRYLFSDLVPERIYTLSVQMPRYNFMQQEIFATGDVQNVNFFGTSGSKPRHPQSP